MKLKYIFFCICSSFILSCENNDSDDMQSGPNLIVKFKFDPNQERLGNLGTPVSIPSGNAAQSPDFNLMSAHYIELAPTAFTALGDGEIVYNETLFNSKEIDLTFIPSMSDYSGNVLILGSIGRKEYAFGTIELK